MILLSIIIPAFNVEQYLTRCLDSCFSMQRDGFLSSEEMEVIVVDDGSTDNTPAMLQEASQQHANLRIIRQENQGQSVARNLAINEAHGQYIYMVDSDDAINENASLPISDIREGRLDIIGVQVLYQPEQGKLRAWSRQMEHWPFDQEFQTGADFVRGHNIEGLVYGYVFRRSLFTKHPELRFTPGIYHQDEELIFKIFTLAGPTIYRRGYTYIYYEHAGSSINTRTVERKRKLIDHHVIILRNLIAWRDRSGVDSPQTQALRNTMHYKLSYLTMDLLRFLIRGSHDTAFICKVIDELRHLGLYPLPWIAEVRYLAMKMLTLRPALVTWWARHGKLNRKIGF